jgi:hypothetical protein
MIHFPDRFERLTSAGAAMILIWLWTERSAIRWMGYLRKCQLTQILEYEV